ncbi:MAG: Rrf2 family transcriptional regulator [Actinomycetota bacterium]|nr:Rrf2 family transcriptional regulator [Actinomycetota bacterium]
MISITSKSPYALSALVELCRHGDDCDPVPIAELARRREIPVQFLEQLFATLRRGGVLRSQRGVKGGYCFARPAGEVSVLELVQLLDGPVGRGAQGVFFEAAQAAAAVLAETTVASVAEQEMRAAGAPMYYI